MFFWIIVSAWLDLLLVQNREAARNCLIRETTSANGPLDGRFSMPQSDIAATIIVSVCLFGGGSFAAPSPAPLAALPLGAAPALTQHVSPKRERGIRQDAS